MNTYTITLNYKAYRCNVINSLSKAFRCDVTKSLSNLARHTEVM